MAVISHTPYTGSTDCQRTNEYISDGHGEPSPERTNRYISDGHGGSTLCEGYNCPNDPSLATAYMELIRHNYERQHPPGSGRSKGSVTHEQIYFSPTEEDNVPLEERMQMTRELIEGTFLKDFPILYCPHDNTADKHTHLSVSPYSIDGSHKLCLNNIKLNELRRAADRICVAHGYSIIENRELWGDKEYRDWFLEVKESGIVKVHPPKEKDMAAFKKERKRARTYSKSKETQAKRKEEIAAYYKELYISTKKRKTSNPEICYTSPVFYSPQLPNKPLTICKVDSTGRTLGELELRSASCLVWAYRTKEELAHKKIPGSEGFQKRLESLRQKTFEAQKLFKDLDIRTQEELILHIKEVGCDIAELKQDIKRQSTILSSLSEAVKQIDLWENVKDAYAYEWLMSQGYTPEKISQIKHDYSLAIGRKAKNEVLLKERSTEYRHLKTAEATIHPMESKELWQNYLEQMFGREVQKKVGIISQERLREQFSQLALVAGLSQQEIDTLLSSTLEAARNTTWIEYRDFLQEVYLSESSHQISRIYDDIRDGYDEIRRLRRMANSIPALGPVSLMLALLVGMYAGFKIAAKEREIDQLRWDAMVEQEYAKHTKRQKLEKLREAKSIYDAEVDVESEQEILAAKLRFYETASEIVGRTDILMEMEILRSSGSLDDQIANAVSRRIRPIHTQKTEENKERGDQ